MKKLIIVVMGVVLAVASIALNASAQSERARGSAGDVSAANVAQIFAKNWDARHLDKVLALYAPDGEFLSEQGRISGHDALEKFFNQMAQMVQSSKMKVHTVSQSESGDLAYVSGDYSEELVLNDTPRKVHGTYVIVLKKIEGKWFIAQHIWADEGAQP